MPETIWRCRKGGFPGPGSVLQRALGRIKMRLSPVSLQARQDTAAPFLSPQLALCFHKSLSHSRARLAHGCLPASQSKWRPCAARCWPKPSPEGGGAIDYAIGSNDESMVQPVFAERCVCAPKLLAYSQKSQAGAIFPQLALSMLMFAAGSSRSCRRTSCSPLRSNTAWTH